MNIERRYGFRGAMAARPRGERYIQPTEFIGLCRYLFIISQLVIRRRGVDAYAIRAHATHLRLLIHFELRHGPSCRHPYGNTTSITMHSIIIGIGILVSLADTAGHSEHVLFISKQFQWKLKCLFYVFLFQWFLRRCIADGNLKCERVWNWSKRRNFISISNRIVLRCSRSRQSP